MNPDNKKPIPQGFPKIRRVDAPGETIVVPSRVETEKPINVLDRLNKIDARFGSRGHIKQAKRYQNLVDDVKEIATEAIIEHIKACDKLDVEVDPLAIKEIIDDAVEGRSIR